MDTTALSWTGKLTETKTVRKMEFVKKDSTTKTARLKLSCSSFPLLFKDLRGDVL